MNLLEEYTPNELAQLTYKELQKRKKKRKDDYCGCTRFASSYRSISVVEQRCFAGACRQNSIYVLRQNPTEILTVLFR